MKKIIKKLLVLGLMVALLVPTCVFAAPEDEEIEKPETIEILFSHDMHSHLEAFPRIKTVMDEKLDENPSTYLLDAGDFSMGTPFQTIYKAEASELRMMGAVGFDATTLGNHEFDYRSSGLATMLNKAVSSGDPLPQMVVSNINWDSTLADKDKKEDGQLLQAALSAYGAKDYTVIEKEGAKIAVFGVFGKESASYAPESGTDFTDPVNTAKNVVAEIQANEDVDLIVCLSHSGTNQTDATKSEDEILAQNVDGIDVIISGHSHTQFAEPLVKNNTVIASCGQYNSNLGSITFTYADGKYEMASYNLVPLDDSVEEDSDIKDLVDTFSQLVDSEYFSRYGYKWDSVLATNSIEFTNIDAFGLNAGEDTLGNLISDSYIYGVKQAEGANYETVDVAVAPAGVIRASFGTGEITAADAFNALSLGTGKDGVAGYPLVSIYLTGSELRTVAEVDATVSDMMQPARLYLSGLNYTYNPNRLMLDRAFNVSLTNEAGEQVDIESNKLYRVVGDLYSCQMLGTVNSKSYGLLSVTPKDKDGNEITNFEDFIIYNSNGTELKDWYALASYIDSFSGDVVPDKYAQVEGRRLVEDSKNIWDLIKDPNRIFIMLVCVIVLAIAIIALIIVLIVKLIRRIRYGKGYKKKRYLKAKKEKSIFSNRPNKYR